MNKETVKTEERKKLIRAAQLALSPEADSRLAGEFDGLRQKLDAVVTSEAAGKKPPEGPLHTEILMLKKPVESGESGGPAEDRDRYPVRGRALFSGAEGFDGVYLSVPKIM